MSLFIPTAAIVFRTIIIVICVVYCPPLCLMSVYWGISDSASLSRDASALGESVANQSKALYILAAAWMDVVSR